MNTATRTARPENVIARYLTVAGEALRDPNLSVTITETGPRDGERLHMTVALCAGCGDEERTGWPDGTYSYSDEFIPTPREQAIAWAEHTARTWAQAHAEKCRAMTKPEGN
ncbi:hypothetical protein [Streptomyces violascens]|uniref:hypothetical protein n=1 Tax=Streptomyces violascens TaxID=67381 RepID=UPI00369A37AD